MFYSMLGLEAQVIIIQLKACAQLQNVIFVNGYL